MRLTPDNTSTYTAQASIRRAVRAGRVVLRAHAKRRMAERGVDRADLFDALMHGTIEPNRAEPELWVAIADVIVSVEIYDDPGVVVITVIR
jgi:hypothetical protein